MDTIIERDNGASAAALIIGIVVLVALVALILFALRVYPFNQPPAPTGTPLNINVNGELPNPTPPNPRY